MWNSRTNTVPNKWTRQSILYTNTGLDLRIGASRMKQDKESEDEEKQRETQYGKIKAVIK